MLNSKIYQMIFDELVPYLPDSWESLIVYLEYGQGSYSFSFFVKQNGKYKKCYDLDNLSENELMTSFQKIDTFVSPERDKAEFLWSNMTMIVNNSGNMHTDFDYTDLSSGTYQFKKAWKKKYLV